MYPILCWSSNTPNALFDVVVVPMILDKPKSCSFVATLAEDRGVVILEWGEAFEAGFMIVLVTVRGLEEAIVVLVRLQTGIRGQETCQLSMRSIVSGCDEE